jgi:lysophospholipase L1-like esterase
MKTLQIILITLTSLIGCKKTTTMPTDTIVAAKSMNTSLDTLNYLALGDSYTIGEAVPQAQSYPYQLAERLGERTFKINPPTIIATTGWTTDNLIDAISRSDIHDKKYDFVTLLIGVNDQYQQLSQDNYKLKFARVLNTAIAFANGDTSRVFVLSIPDWGVTPFAGGQDSIIGPQIDLFNAINKAASLAAGVHYLDITGISRQAATDASLIAADGLHPSGKMYVLWVDLLEPMVEAKFKK